MNTRIVAFACGAAAGAAAASVAWSLSLSGTRPEAAVPEPVAEAPAETAPAASVRVPESLPEVPADTAEVRPDAEADPAPPPAADAAQEAAPPRGPSGTPGPERRRPRWDEMTEAQREEMRQGFRRMHDERATRIVDEFVSRNGLGDDAGARVFAIAEEMNERAQSRIQLWTDYIQLQGRERIAPDQGARMMRDLFDDLVSGYEELDAAFGTAWRDDGAGLDLGQMVDPEVWGALFRIGGGPGGPRGPRPGGRGLGGPGPGGQGARPGAAAR